MVRELSDFAGKDGVEGEFDATRSEIDNGY